MEVCEILLFEVNKVALVVFFELGVVDFVVFVGEFVQIEPHGLGARGGGEEVGGTDESAEVVAFEGAEGGGDVELEGLRDEEAEVLRVPFSDVEPDGNEVGGGLPWRRGRPMAEGGTKERLDPGVGDVEGVAVEGAEPDEGATCEGFEVEGYCGHFFECVNA